MPSVEELVARFRQWTGEHAKPQRERFDAHKPATAKQIAALEKALGAALPETFKAYLRLSDGGLSVFEYEGTPIDEILEHHLGSIASGKKTFKQLRWVPFASDGGGNKWALDVERDEVRRWERAGANSIAGAVGFAGFVANLVNALETGEHRYEPDSKTYDGPFVDLLEAPTSTRAKKPARPEPKARTPTTKRPAAKPTARKKPAARAPKKPPR